MEVNDFEYDTSNRRCRCLFCAGDCLCDECDYSGECKGHGCDLMRKTDYSSNSMVNVTVENIDGDKTNVEFRYIQSFTHGDIEELFTSVDWLGDMSVDDLLNALNKSSKLISAYVDNKLVGLIRCMHDGYFSGTIDCLIVHKDYQNKGIGSALIKAMIDATDYIKYLSVSPSERNNIALYAKCGFCEITNGALMQIVR